MIACNLSVLLAERNLKISQVSKATGISRTTLTSLALNNAKGIQFDTLNSLCTYLEITPDQFIRHTPYEIQIEKIENDPDLSEDNARRSDALIYFRVTSKYDNRLIKLSLGMHKEASFDGSFIYYAHIQPLYNKSISEKKQSIYDIDYLFTLINKLPFQIYDIFISDYTKTIIKNFKLVDESPIIRISWDLGPWKIVDGAIIGFPEYQNDSQQ